MSNLLKPVRAWLEKEQLPYMDLPGGESLAIRFEGFNGTWTCLALAHDDRQEFIFYSMVTGVVMPEYRLLVAEYLMRANYGLSIGNFEIDMNDGEVRFRTAIDVANDRLSPALIKGLIYSNWVTMDRYLPGLLDVMSGRATPLDAIKAAEADLDL